MESSPSTPNPHLGVEGVEVAREQPSRAAQDKDQRCEKNPAPPVIPILLYGWSAIAAALGMPESLARALGRAGVIKTFRVGKRGVAALLSGLQRDVEMWARAQGYES